jgi:hypothetical protein
MPANKTNYLVFYEGDSQVYGCSSKEIALSSPPPAGRQLEDKRVFFVAVEPDGFQFVWREIPREDVLQAEIKHKKEKKET